MVKKMYILTLHHDIGNKQEKEARNEVVKQT